MHLLRDADVSGGPRAARELWVEMGLHAKHTAPSLESRPLR